MKSRSWAAGFTIVETLIVLAVTSGLFAVIAVTLGARQRATEFSQGTRLIQTDLQKIMSDVSSGYYAGTNNFNCSIGPSGVPALSVGSATNNRGTQKECVFFGRAVQLAVGGSNGERSNVYTLVGRQGTEELAAASQTLSAIRPVVAAKSVLNNTASYPDVYDVLKFPYGLTVKKAYHGTNPNSNPIFAFAVVSSVGQYGGGDTSGQLNILAIPGTSLNATKESGVDLINSSIQSSVFNPPGGISICVESGGTNQSVTYSIGNNNRTTNVSQSVRQGAC